MPECPSHAQLDAIFPPERTDQFFEALYGGAEEGAYDIRLICKRAQPGKLELAFALHRREGKCLKCTLTYGLPEVFSRHPVINAQKIAEEAAKAAGIAGPVSWKMGETQEINDDLQLVPFIITAPQSS